MRAGLAANLYQDHNDEVDTHQRASVIRRKDSPPSHYVTSTRNDSYSAPTTYTDSSISKPSPWGRPRGRRTIQDKIAEQEARAAEIERELYSIGVPSAGPKPSASSETGPQKHGKNHNSRKHDHTLKKTIAVSVIKKSPPVVPLVVGSPSPEPESLPISPPPGPFYLPYDPPCIPLNRNVILVPSMMFRFGGIRPANQLLPLPFMRGPPVDFSQRMAENREDIAVAPHDGQFGGYPAREERLSTKLKRIKAKAGYEPGDSPRGFLTQKIETLKKRENSLQREYEDVISLPITRSGISSAQYLQHQYLAAAANEQRDHEALLLHMMKSNAEMGQKWPNIRALPHQL